MLITVTHNTEIRQHKKQNPTHQQVPPPIPVVHPPQHDVSPLHPAVGTEPDAHVAPRPGLHPEEYLLVPGLPPQHHVTALVQDLRVGPLGRLVGGGVASRPAISPSGKGGSLVFRWYPVDGLHVADVLVEQVLHARGGLEVEEEEGEERDDCLIPHGFRGVFRVFSTS